MLPGFIYQLKMNPQGEFTWLYLSHGVERILGLPVAEALQDVNRLLSLVIMIAFLARALPLTKRRKAGSVSSECIQWMAEAHNASQKMVNGDIIFTGFANNVTEKRELEKQLEVMSHYDALTGLLNRSSFYEILENTIRTSHRKQQHFALLFIDLDHFKLVNDNFGHRTGDLLLQSVGNCIRQSLRAADASCRYGGDEFLVLLPDVTKADDLTKVARKILRQHEQPFVLEGHTLQISASIGVSLFPAHGSKANTLINLADQAMYQAKHSESDNIRIFGR